MRGGWKRGSAPSPIKRNRPPSGLPRVLMQEPMHDPSAHDKGAEAPQGFGWRGINPPVGCKQARPSSKPFAASAISPGPFRGWGRHPLACIHTQREPVFSPAGTGTEYRRPQAVSWHLAALRARRQETARGWTGTPRSAEPRRARFDGAMTFSPCQPRSARAGRAHRCRRERALGSPAGAREVCPAVGSSRRGRGRRGRQFALGRRRGVLEVRPDAPRLPAAASSTGCVPLQSG